MPMRGAVCPSATHCVWPEAIDHNPAESAAAIGTLNMNTVRYHISPAGDGKITCHGQEALVGGGTLRGIHRHTDSDSVWKWSGSHGRAVRLRDARRNCQRRI